MRPNLLKFATSELSQDAAIAWLLSWAAAPLSSLDQPLHNSACDLLRLAFAKHKRPFPGVPAKFDVRRQHLGIDLLVTLDDQWDVVVEDKVYSQQHSGQLKRYIDALVAKGRERDWVLPLYVQTGDQADYSAVVRDGYQPVLRQDLLQILRQARTSGSANDILVDFLEHLEYIEKMTNSFASLPLQDWDSWFAWRGFFAALVLPMGNDGGWSWVNNPQGGFHAFFWCWPVGQEFQQYMQLENEKLCCKVWVKDAHHRRTLRDKWSALVLAAGQQSGLPIVRPPRMGTGTTMTVAIRTATTGKSGPTAYWTSNGRSSCSAGARMCSTWRPRRRDGAREASPPRRGGGPAYSPVPGTRSGYLSTACALWPPEC